MKWNKVEINAP